MALSSSLNAAVEVNGGVCSHAEQGGYRILEKGVYGNC